MIPSEFRGIEFWRLGKEHIPEERIGQGAGWALFFLIDSLEDPMAYGLCGFRDPEMPDA